MSHLALVALGQTLSSTQFGHFFAHLLASVSIHTDHDHLGILWCVGYVDVGCVLTYVAHRGGLKFLRNVERNAPCFAYDCRRLLDQWSFFGVG